MMMANVDLADLDDLDDLADGCLIIDEQLHTISDKCLRIVSTVLTNLTIGQPLDCV